MLAGTAESEERAFSSVCQRRRTADEPPHGDAHMGLAQVVDDLRMRGAIVKNPSMRGVAEEAPGAYEHVSAVMGSAQAVELAKKVA